MEKQNSKKYMKGKRINSVQPSVHETLNMSKLYMLGLFSHYMYPKTPETSFKKLIGPKLMILQLFLPISVKYKGIEARFLF